MIFEAIRDETANLYKNYENYYYLRLNRTFNFKKN